MIEVHVFTRAQLEELAKRVAKTQIISSLYRGEFKEQKAEWLFDGSQLRIFTEHEPAKEGAK